jgi:hypothetical protein
LYLDESGNENDPADKHFVLAGAAVFERTTYFLSRDIEQIQTKHFPGSPPIPFHGSAIRSGKGFWRKVEPDQRDAVITDLSAVIAGQPPATVVLFGAVIEKSSQLWGEKAIERATEEVTRRFDVFLMRRFQEEDNDPQRGLLIFAEGRFHTRARIWVQGFRELGTRWGGLRNLSDIPYFVSMSETRLLQVADFVAHALFLLYERRDATLIRPILRRFHYQDGVLHGLVHHKPDTKVPCDCPACASRAKPHQFGSWLPEQPPPIATGQTPAGE